MVLHNSSGDPLCWRCGRAAPADTLATLTVLRSRPADEGGPYRVWGCGGCGEECGAVENARGAWALHPLEGFDDAPLLDRLVPRRSRDGRRAAEEWWQRNAAALERFRRATRPPGEERPKARRAPRPGARRPGGPTAGATERPPPRARARARRTHTRPEGAPRDEPAVTRSAAAAPLDDREPHVLLGIPADADADTIRRAYRAALKLCHPDRVANLDPEIQDLATRKARALRRAYEDLLARRTDSA